jgi:hypothetical protein
MRARDELPADLVLLKEMERTLFRSRETERAGNLMHLISAEGFHSATVAKGCVVLGDEGPASFTRTQKHDSVSFL